ncbi:HAD family hydrolase [Streptomyces albus subsp. albus]|nr:HAD family hydrolase [Streptomyces albus subsp. albus]
MSVLVASDLDRTLIYSAAALGLDMPDAEAPRLLCVEVYDRKPLSYMTEQAAALLAEVARTSLFVPATTRTREQYRRVRLPGPPPRFAVCANGGHLLVDGETDPEWHDTVRAALADRCAPLDEVRAHLHRTGDPAWLLKERTAEDLFAYLVVERGLLPEDYLKELTEWAEPRGWTVSLQGRKIYAVPKPLTKSAAVAEVARRTGATEILAAGDSLLDADLLHAADHGWRPGHGELAAEGWLAPQVTAVPEQGVAAGQAIVEAIAEHASTARARARSEAAIRAVSRSRH